MNRIRYLILIIPVLFLLNQKLDAQMVIRDVLTNQELVEQVLLGDGVQVYNITATGDPDAIGEFVNTAPPGEMPMDSGIIMSSGDIFDAPGPNSSDGTTTQHGTPGDSDLESILGGGYDTYDAAVIEFDFKSPADTVRFNYIFASEEYREYVCSNFNDAFGFLLSGPNPSGGNYTNENIALVPGTNTEVAIKTVNNGSSSGSCPEENSNSSYYFDNLGGGPGSGYVEYDGLTDMFTAEAVVVPCQEYHIKLVIADVGDRQFDSGVFLEANSFAAEVDSVYADFVHSGAVCTGEDVQFYNAGPSGTGITYEWDFAGSASQSSAFTENPSVSWSTPGLKRVDYKVIINCGTDSATISKYVNVYDRPDPSFNFTNNVCEGSTVDFTNTGSSGSNFNHEWIFTTDAQPSEAYTENPQVVFNTPGDKVVKHIVSNDHCTNVEFDTVTIQPGPEASFTSTAPVCSSDSVDFTNTGSSTNVSYNWTFGPDATPANSNVENPSGVSFTSDGIKNVSLTITDNTSGCQATHNETFEVLPVPNASFNFTNNVCIGTNVDFNNTGSSGSQLSYLWDFGSDASTNTSQNENPQNISFNSSGNHTINLSVSNGSCSDSDTQTITVENSPAPDISFSHDGPKCENDSVSFSFDGSGTGLNFLWDFDTGANPATSTSVNPTGVVYNSDGIKDVELNVTDAGTGCTNNFNQSLNILPDPVASFSVVSDTICASTGIDFTNTGSSDQVFSYTWDFGTDAVPNSSGAENPQGVYYTSSGEKIITFTISNPQCVTTFTDTIYVEQTPPADISFSHTAPQCNDDFVDFSFDGDSTGFDFSWNFGTDANPSSSTAVNPVGVTFDSAGNHTVELTVTGQSSGCSITTTESINILPDPIASFDVVDTTCASDYLNFTNTGSSGQNYSYAWDFGTDATPATSGSENPQQVYYSTPGSKVVNLTVSTSQCVESITDTIIVEDSPPDNISFTSNAPQCSNDSVDFSFDGDTTGYNFTWNFGPNANQTISNLAEPSGITFDTAGSYSITLTLTSPASGCSSSVTQSINILHDPVASFTFTDTICAGTNIDFTNDGSSGAMYSYSWDFGTDASPAYSTTENPQDISYTSSGEKVIKLTVSTSNCVQSYTDTLVVDSSPAPMLDFSSTAPVCEENDVNFNINNYDPNLNYTWNFGNGSNPTSSPLQNPVVSYSSDGIKTVSLTAVNPSSGCSNYVEKTIDINPRPDVSFISSAPVCEGSNVDFSNEGSSGSEYTYSWDFGDDASPAISTTENPTGISYSSPGNKDISLTISDGNCTRTVLQNIEILGKPHLDFTTNAPKCSGMPVEITNMSDSLDIAYNWNFGNNSSPQISSDINPVLVYDTSGVFDIVLHASDTVTNCSDSMTLQININQTPKADFSSTAPQCPGETVNFFNEGDSGQDFSYEWSFGENSIPESSTAENPAGINFTTGNEKVISFTVRNNLCTNTVIDTISLYPLPVAEAGTDTIICANRSVQIGTPAISGYSYLWLPQSTLDDNSLAQPIASPEAEFTTYNLTVTDDTTGCTNTDFINVTMLPAADAIAGPDVSICATDSVQIGAGLIEGQNYYWSPENSVSDFTAPNPLVSPDTTTTYVLHASYAGCDTVTDEVEVTVHPLPDIDAGKDVTIAKGEKAQLNATGGVNYEWSPYESISNPYIAAPVVSPDDSITYYVSGNDVFGCTNLDSINVFVNIPDFFVPNSFTPDGDGKNDKFYVRGEPLADFEITIYNRLNQSVYHSKDYYKGWDGTIQSTGEKCTEGAYVYIITGKNQNGEDVKESGIINLIR